MQQPLWHTLKRTCWIRHTNHMIVLPVPSCILINLCSLFSYLSQNHFFPIKEHLHARFIFIAQYLSRPDVSPSDRTFGTSPYYEDRVQMPGFPSRPVFDTGLDFPVSPVIIFLDLIIGWLRYVFPASSMMSPFPSRSHWYLIFGIICSVIVCHILLSHTKICTPKPLFNFMRFLIDQRRTFVVMIQI